MGLIRIDPHFIVRRLDNLINRTNLNKYSVILFLLLFTACEEPAKVIVVPDNPIPPYHGVSELAVKSFVYRAYIDLIGREPLETELIRDYGYLQRRELEMGAIDTLLYRLQHDTTFISGDLSYRHAYSWQVYVKAKARTINGESDSEMEFDIQQLEQKYVKDSLLGDKLGMAFALKEIQKLRDVIQSSVEFRDGQIDIQEMYRRMLLNEIYDEINMGSFNFVNASFDDLFFRFPTTAEFEAAFDVVEFNKSREILGTNCQTKQGYAEVLTESREFYEAGIQGEFLSLLGRSATDEELLSLFADYYENHDYAWLQREIMKIPEYGGL